MKNSIQSAYESVKLSEKEKQQMLKKIKQQGRKKSFYWISGAAAVAAAAVLAALLIPGLNADKNQTALSADNTPTGTAEPVLAEEVFARITLSINPSVEFRLDSDGTVIEVVGTNEDGIALVEGMDAAGLTLENATILVVNRLIENGYITDSRIVNEITVTIDSGDCATDTIEMMSGIIKTAAGAYDIDVDVQRSSTANGVNIVLAGNDAGVSPQPSSQAPDSSPQPNTSLIDVMPPEETRTVLFECDSEKLGNIWMYGDDDVRHDFVRFVSDDLKEIVMHGLSYLIDTGFIVDTNILYELKLSDPTEQRLKELYDVANMMIKESGLMLEVWQQPNGASIYLDDMAKTPREAQYTMNEILNPLILKDTRLITQQQMQILEYVYTDEELIDMLGKPNRFKVMPDLVGLTEQKAVELAIETGMVPEVEYSFNPMYRGETGTVNGQYMEALCMYEKGRTCGIVVQIDRPEGPCIVDSYVPVDMSIEDYETYLMENGLVEAHMTLENIGMPPDRWTEEYGKPSQQLLDMYNEALEKIGVELKYLMPWEKAEYFGNDETQTKEDEMTGYPKPVP